MKALVTGASGFIGRRLLRPGDRAFSRHRCGWDDEVVGDLFDPAGLVAACAGVETIFHCAGVADALHGDEAALMRVNVEGTKHLLAAADMTGVKRFVFFSSVKAMAEPGDECVDEDWPGDPSTPYGRSKRAAEDAVLEAGEKFGMHVVNLRLAMVYGRGSQGNLWKMAQAIRGGWFPPLAETGNRRSLVHVQDVVDVARWISQQPQANGRTYIVADPQPYSTRQLYDALRHACGLPPARWRVPALPLRGAMALGGPIGEYARRLAGSSCYSPERIRRELGWQARIGLAEGLREMFG